MPSSPDPAIAFPRPSATVMDEKSGVRFDEKNTNQEVVGEFQESSRRIPPAACLRSVPGAFSREKIKQYGTVVAKFGKFTGPGAIIKLRFIADELHANSSISVAYIDPDNYQTDVSAGAEFKYRLLFMLLVSNLIAIYLQSLSVKLGSVTGMDLAQMNRAHLPHWLNICLWLLAEASIVCTDIGQVIGTAIAINILIPKIPLVAGCALAIVDTLFILFFYRPDGSMKSLRAFEFFIAVFVIAVFICFCIELSIITGTTARQVFAGFLPSREIFVASGLYQSCAILCGTLMPHTLYLGSGLVQARLRDFDIIHSSYREQPTSSNPSVAQKLYRPSLSAIHACLNYSIAELCVTLFIVAMFVNSSIMIISASSLSVEAQNADLFGMWALFRDDISPAAGTMFALALLFSGISAGIVATMAGQMVAEGAMNWRIKPFYRRLLTRGIAIIPGIIVAGIEGRNGLAAALNGCNVVLAIALIFLTFPLIWFTSFDKYMLVETESSVSSLTVGGEAGGTIDVGRVGDREGLGLVSLKNNLPTAMGAWAIWVLIAAMNVATLTFLGLGIGGD